MSLKRTNPTNDWFKHIEPAAVSCNRKRSLYFHEITQQSEKHIRTKEVVQFLGLKGKYRRRMYAQIRRAFVTA